MLTEIKGNLNIRIHKDITGDRCGLWWGRNLGDGIKNWDRSIEVHNIFPLYEFFCRPYDIVEYLKKEC